MILIQKERKRLHQTHFIQIVSSTAWRNNGINMHEIVQLFNLILIFSTTECYSRNFVRALDWFRLVNIGK